MHPRVWNRVLRFALVMAGVVCVMSDSAIAQENREPAGAPLPDYARVYSVEDGREPTARLVPLSTNGLPNIMLTGYWPPTNEMLRQFSPNPEQNTNGWVGENWEGRGYNVYAFFPEFPQGLGKGEGDFEVDYQDTSADFWYFTAEVDPVAMITFGRAGVDVDWELEWRYRNLSTWVNDYEAPFQPTPSPPDGSVPAGHIRYCSLPTRAIVDAVNGAGLGINAFVDTTGDAGAFLCEYVGYHATWYHDLHSVPGSPPRNAAAGHIHVGSLIDLADTVAATEITVRTLIDSLPVPGDYDGDGAVDLGDFGYWDQCMTGPEGGPYDPACAAFDFEFDGDVDVQDFGGFQTAFTG